MLLAIEHLTKRFDGVTVLDDAHLEVRAGEVHGLAGQNGSGKSTLIKCLCGFHQPSTPWSLTVNDQHLTRPLHPGEPGRLGMSFVHQDLGLLPDLSVLDNLLLFRIGADRTPFVRWDHEAARARGLFATFGIEIDPRTRLADLRPVEQAQVAIVRAVSQLHHFGTSHPGSRGVLVLDEATTFLDRPGRESLHALIRSIAASGFGVLFVSHDVQELLAVADRVTVLRDGRVIETASSEEISHDEVVGLIVGGKRTARLAPADRDRRTATGTGPGGGEAPGPTEAPVSAAAPVSTAAPVSAAAPVVVAPAGATVSSRDGNLAGEVLHVSDLSGDFVRGVDFTARPGEILGLTGIVGGGWELVLEFLYGARRAAGGTLRLGERTLPIPRCTPEQSIKLGMVYVPANRLAHGIVGELTVQENVMLPVLGRMFQRAHLQLARMAARCRRLLGDYAVQPREPRLPIAALSGGNQQKAVLAKWLQLVPEVVLLNEPTQGVDVGARQLIVDEIRTRVAAGATVLYASGNWDEIAAVADRVVVVADGSVAAVLEGDQVTVDAIAREAYRGTRQSTAATGAADIWELVG